MGRGVRTRGHGEHPRHPPQPSRSPSRGRRLCRAAPWLHHSRPRPRAAWFPGRSPPLGPHGHRHAGTAASRSQHPCGDQGSGVWTAWVGTAKMGPALTAGHRRRRSHWRAARSAHVRPLSRSERPCRSWRQGWHLRQEEVSPSPPHQATVPTPSPPYLAPGAAGTAPRRWHRRRRSSAPAPQHRADRPAGRRWVGSEVRPHHRTRAGRTPPEAPGTDVPHGAAAEGQSQTGRDPTVPPGIAPQEKPALRRGWKAGGGPRPLPRYLAVMAAGVPRGTLRSGHQLAGAAVAAGVGALLWAQDCGEHTVGPPPRCHPSPTAGPGRAAPGYRFKPGQGQLGLSRCPPRPRTRLRPQSQPSPGSRKRFPQRGLSASCWGSGTLKRHQPSPCPRLRSRSCWLQLLKLKPGVSLRGRRGDSEEGRGAPATLPPSPRAPLAALTPWASP